MARAKARKPIEGEHSQRKRAKGKQLFGRLPWFASLFIALAIAGLVVFVCVYFAGHSCPDNLGKPRAAIVDQLSSLGINEDFLTGVTAELEDYGFEVDLYQGDEITVDFYRRLPTHCYELIIFRAHSGLVGDGGGLPDRTLLFTNEEYSTGRYRLEQAWDRLGKGSAGEGYPMMFGITAEFIASRTMKGRFDDTVIIMMGCSGIFLTDMARAFIDKGASVYIAWTGSVVLDYVDRATPYLLEQLCSQNLTIRQAIDSTRDVIGDDPIYEAWLKYYPARSGDKTVAELLPMAFDGEDETGAEIE